MVKNTKTSVAPEKRTKLSQTEFPNNSLEGSLRIAQAIIDHYAGRSAAPHDIAMALELSPTSGGWRNLCGSSIAYGLTEGGYAADQIALTALGRRIVSPTDEGDDLAAKVEAMLKPRVSREFFEKYDKQKFPRDDIGKNVLASMGLPRERTEKSFEILRENGKFVGVIRETKTGPFVALGSPVARQERQDDDELPDNVVASTPESSIAHAGDAASKPRGSALAGVDRSDAPKQIFVAHGKNRKPLEDLKKILDQFKIPYKVAVDEPHAGRPISKKVAQLMTGSSAGIFIFTKDEKFVRDNGEEVWRPSENVVYELGAASILWENKIIILREAGVNFPSDFSDLGYITFEDGQIATKALDLLKELVALEFVKVQAT
jgi:predicted nucleotide-binding protein